VLRGDVEQIVVGAFTSFQDGAIAHADPGTPLHIGAGCTSPALSSPAGVSPSDASESG
jgi:carbonic anhydrase/acetyltransferase-like protein (isoleucine patch superfamily)